ncbi:hypothetical protein EF294_16840 [Gordonia oryzae]|uniref:Uncharacterized protein n=1 Tax=Gordonia oryzae TaxID=2487349 RepID=A0A3N4G6X2_9ACTN|nr:hypothetical protein [Gordonia oryzae]RPA58065.1 hypothetical protein EF294_16840 [Gordonia oryzae]
MSAVIDPVVADRWLRELAVLAAGCAPDKRNARWNTIRDRHSPKDIDEMLHVAIRAVRVRIDELLDGRPTVEGVLGIAAMSMNRVGLDDPTRTGSLLAGCLPGADHTIGTLDAQRLPWLMATIGMPADPETLRGSFVADWLRTQRVDTTESVETLRQAVLDSLILAAPPGWTSITGTLCAAAGAARATLRVTRGDGDVGICAPVRIPALHRLRTLDARNAMPWWRAEIVITDEGGAFLPTSPDIAPPPVDLMRPSDYRAEAEVNGIDLPPWAVRFCATGVVPPATAPVLAPAAATDAALIWLACRNIEVDPRRLMIERVAAGYRVYARTGHNSHVVHVTDTGETSEMP